MYGICGGWWRRGRNLLTTTRGRRGARVRIARQTSIGCMSAARANARQQWQNISSRKLRNAAQQSENKISPHQHGASVFSTSI